MVENLLDCLGYSCGGDAMRFDSMINIRPSQGNRSRDVESEEIRGRIATIVEKRISG